MKNIIKRFWWVALIVVAFVLFMVYAHISIVDAMKQSEQTAKKFAKEMKIEVPIHCYTNGIFGTRCSALLNNKPVKYQCLESRCTWELE